MCLFKCYSFTFNHNKRVCQVKREEVSLRSFEDFSYMRPIILVTFPSKVLPEGTSLWQYSQNWLVLYKIPPFLPWYYHGTYLIVIIFIDFVDIKICNFDSLTIMYLNINWEILYFFQLLNHQKMFPSLFTMWNMCKLSGSHQIN